jgi:hypothetical protein
MLVAKQNLRPLAVIFFKHSSSRNKNRRGICPARIRRRFRRETIYGQHLLQPIPRKVSMRQDFRVFAQGRFGDSPSLVFRIGAFGSRLRVSGRCLLLRVASGKAKRHDSAQHCRHGAQFSFPHNMSRTE